MGRIGDFVSEDEDLLVLGPLFEDEAARNKLEALGLSWYDDFFSINHSGGEVPEWCQLKLGVRGAQVGEEWPFQGYVRDVIFHLRERAREAHGSKEASAFQQGRLLAYQEVLSHMQNQAMAFDIPPELIALDGLDPMNNKF